MKILYLTFYILFNLGFRLYFKRVRTLNIKRKGLGRTIYVSNHPAAFMDPLAIALYGKRVVHFMARADVFKTIFKPIFTAAHMLPIYRQLDGGDTREKNKQVFLKTSELIRKNGNILIFGEGFTDEVFIRRVKPIKKGAFRIGFSALEAMNWEHKVYVNGIGCNYSAPNMARSELLLASADPICLNDYRSDYEENPSRIISVLTAILEADIKNSIIHVENQEWLEFHDHAMKLTRQGMDPLCYDDSYSLEQRYHYGRQLAKSLNDKSEEELVQLEPLKSEITAYFNGLASLNISENERYLNASKSWGIPKRLLKILVSLPFALLGLIHAGLWYLLVKRFVEKVFKRPVFWGSSKLIILLALVGIVNIPFIFLIAHYFACLGSVYAYLIAFTYYFFIWFYAFMAYAWKIHAIHCYRYLKVRKLDLSSFNDTADRLKRSIHSILKS